MQEVAFEVKQEALAVIRNTVIEANFDEVKAALTEMIAPYKTMAVTADGIAAAKSDRARIRKVANGIDEMRKTVGREYKKPLAEFEAKCKELVSICDEGAGNLDGQIKAYEDAEAQSKIDAIRAVYDEGDAEVREFCPWERVYNEKWRNKGFSFDDAKDSVLAEFKKTREDLATIRAMDAQDVPALLLEYKRTRDLAVVVRMSVSLKQAHEEQKKREAAERQSAEAILTEHMEERAEISKEIESAAEANEVVWAGPAKKADFKVIDFRVWATQEQLMALKGFLRANGIKYGRVD